MPVEANTATGGNPATHEITPARMTEQPIAVTQGDRGAAALLYERVSNPSWNSAVDAHTQGGQHVLDGKGDGSPFVQAFARYRLAERERCAKVEEALIELVECARLRGDNDLPHPCDDPKLWTARMIDAWGEAEALADDISDRSSSDAE